MEFRDVIDYQLIQQEKEDQMLLSGQGSPDTMVSRKAKGKKGHSRKKSAKSGGRRKAT